MKKKACKNCKIFVDGDLCPICKKGSFSTTWQGRIHFIDTKKSMIAHEMDVETKGEYAIKVR
ncbi:MAG: DNA-directed RNA polymerase subunit E'' [Nanoarchaeota archaeon]|nr:DNA-directed RNA polymerase subunit E'' [Nanoarchaeota archaeon]MBU1269340.1 DNA-directed RNA polymerase subunit E'' [Nanoarchaeota archaeon]MBU1603843.1 DNA-directed RNA polymerase subunit E'' [Nanoarchaeota archaeon]MBU2442675.1 DNA-directed RNA polymerase subunit E'' [Nanoarchaeota archaeon]